MGVKKWMEQVGERVGGIPIPIPSPEDVEVSSKNRHALAQMIQVLSLRSVGVLEKAAFKKKGIHQEKKGEFGIFIFE